MLLKQIPFAAILLMFSCSNPGTDNTAAADNTPYSNETGTGKFTTVAVSVNLDQSLADKGQLIFENKCVACHKRTNEKLIGPGLQGITTRRKAGWILNLLTNTDAMLNYDPQLRAQMEKYQVRMPDADVSEDEARSVYEFLRKNDGVK
ncbi:hypothetical protein BH09BAC2_BH09BAC2_04340 [soil metagenome]